MNQIPNLAGSIAMAIGFCLPASAMSQQVESADVNIVSVTAEAISRDFVCTAIINNQNDDDARDARVIMLLPLQTPKVRSATVSGGPGSCKVQTPSANSSGFVEVVQCELGQLPQGIHVRRTVTVTVAPSTAAATYKRTCGAFVYSSVGDIDPANNYKSAVAP